VTAILSQALATWREGPRVRPLNDRSPEPGGRYVLCWLRQALRARDNPVIDAAIRLSNACHLPVLVYHGVQGDYPYASDRLHHFIVGAGVDLAAGCSVRGLACVRYVDRAGAREKELVHRLAADAVAVVLEDQPSFVASWQSERVAARACRCTRSTPLAWCRPPYWGRALPVAAASWAHRSPSGSPGASGTKRCRTFRPIPARCPSSPIGRRRATSTR